MRRKSCIDFILDLEMHGIKLGLEKIRLLLAELGSPQLHYPCVLVGGTNGKGSVTAILAETLARAGYRCGRYTSPHLVSFAERICLNNRPIPAAALERGATRARAAIRRVVASGRYEAPCTFFEATTAIALDYFARAGVDAAVLEVGMGGRFDATNAIDPILSAITNIELDHERYLGTTRTAIAGEKVGIARAGVPLVVGRTDEEPLTAIRAGCERAGAFLYEAERRVRAELIDGPGDRRVPPAAATAFTGARGTLASAGEWVRFSSERRVYGPLQLGLAGRHQIDNAVTAIATLERLEEAGFRLGAEMIEAGLERVRWPGRLEHLPGRPLILLDGAHNPAGARALASYLVEKSYDDLTLVFGAMQDKSIAPMAEALFPLARRVVLTRSPNRRSAYPQALRESLASLHPALAVAEDPAEALDAALALTSPGGVICVCGSLYLVGSVRELSTVRQRRRRPRPAVAAAF